ncbi:MAG: GNAT family N-acetyltransferase [Myxococcota bacterium]|nr:GNAT family N-acetyltransferase [Myxococcota bacterium]
MTIDSVRCAEERDLPRLGQLAGGLVRMHHEADPKRFMLVDDVEQGYARWFSSELQRAEAIVLVADRGDEVVGYAYGRLEGRDWNMLLDRHGVVHDVYVDAKVRRCGAGRWLLHTLVEELEGRGAPRIVLSTMVANEAAQRLFRSCGFRATMLEMTR